MSTVAPTQIAETGSSVAAAPPPPPPDTSMPGVEHPQGWEDLYRSNVGPVYHYIYARTGNRADAEDLTSQVFLQAFPRLGWRTTPEMRSYLFTTARTVLADHWRQHYSVELDELPFDAADPGGSPDDGGDGTSARRAADLLDRLPERYHRVLELRFLQGCSVRETARMMGVSVANAKVIQLRALRLAAQLGA